jgi:uncharacterized protein (DUF697 family)
MLKTITSTANTVGSLEYKGLWNAATNTPTLVSSVGTQGDYYVVSVAGTTNLDGVTTWDEGDWAIFNGSVWQLFQGGQDGVFATLTVSGEIAANGGIALGDNDKATFGGSDDLQIYHDGTHSVIYDAGVGDLRINAVNLNLRSSASGENYLYATNNGAVQIYYDGLEKLATTATGIDITGTATMDGLTVSKTDGSIVKLESTGTGLGAGAVIGDLQFYGNDASTPGAGIKASITATTVAALGDDSQLMFSTSDGTTNNVNRMLIANNGDVSFYENTGTTPKFVWDSSAESLGIGTSSPAQAKLDILLESDYSSHTGHGLSILSNAADAYTSLYIGTDDTIDSAYIQSAGKNTSFTSKKLLLNPNGGNVGIGCTPNESLHVYNATTNVLANFESGDSKAFISFKDNSTTNTDTVFLGADGNNMAFYAGSASLERMRIDGVSGSVGIGTSTPQTSAKGLHVVHDATEGTPAFPDGEVIIAQRNFNSSQGCHIGIIAGTASESVINFGDKDDSDIGNIVYNHSSNDMRFTTNTAERARLTSDGNFLVGKTSSDLGATAGIELSGQYDVGYFTRSGDKPLVVNRLSSDGSITDFRKDGTSVGSIGTNSAVMYLGSDDVGLRFDATSNALSPWNTTTAALNDAGIDLGRTTGRFKDLYLSGGVYLGGTGAANTAG